MNTNDGASFTELCILRLRKMLSDDPDKFSRGEVNAVFTAIAELERLVGLAYPEKTYLPKRGEQ